MTQLPDKQSVHITCLAKAHPHAGLGTHISSHPIIPTSAGQKGGSLSQRTWAGHVLVRQVNAERCRRVQQLAELPAQPVRLVGLRARSAKVA